MEKDIAEKYNAFTTKKGNTVWVGTMCLAWNQLAQTEGVNHLEFNTQKPDALKVIHNFNHSAFSRKDIDDKSTYIKAGKGPATQTLINKEVKQKFPNYSFPDLVYAMAPSDIISFAYLFKQLTFGAKFERRQDNSFLFNGNKVESFYAKEEGHKKQIKVSSYKDRDNFCISIPDKSTSDVIYLLKTAEGLTVDQVIAEVQKAEGQASKSISKVDIFEMPIITLDCVREFKEMVGLGFSNPTLKE